MKGAGLSRFLSILLLASFAAAWPWPDSFRDIEDLIMRRQESSTAEERSRTSSASGSSKSAAPSSTTEESVSGTITDAPTSTGSESAESSTDGSAAATTGESGSRSASGSRQSGASRTSSRSSKTTNVDPRLPPGGIQMVTPAVIAGPQYYKIGDHVTFAWNYTSLSVTPSYIDVLASCSMNSQMYTISANQSVDPTGAVTWDTGDYQASATVPLLTETYTLVVMDAQLDISATAKAGYLGVSDQYTFGMYVPQPYTPLNEFKCATCSAALSAHERQALGFVLGMSAITILSFTWFAGGFGVFS
ncbi:hypothetical protein GJ744_008702 [Endocarpon pusillum]|uniref:DUF7137 domain-containing protein n=1 Tax=Endocarpon pusillum TaxID=364733 RepID=A0A8H7E517_9EURO|nr:hypothetical protein GJ744_008702 [Endocarpon pusillum]